MMTTNLFVIANVKQLRTGGSFRILLPFFSENLWVLASKIQQFLSFHNRVEFGLRNFGGCPNPPSRYATGLCSPHSQTHIHTHTHTHTHTLSLSFSLSRLLHRFGLIRWIRSILRQPIALLHMLIPPSSNINGGARGGAGGWDFVLQAGRSRVPFPIVIGIFYWHNPSGRSMALGLTQPLKKRVPGVFPGGKSGRCVGPTTLPLSSADCL